MFEACSSNDDTTEPLLPPTVAITDISVGPGDTSVLSCDHIVGVKIALENFTLKPPGACTAPQCGRARVSLLDGPNGKVLVSRVAANTGVELDLDELKQSDGSLLDVSALSGSYGIEVELLDDAGKLVVVADGGNGSAQGSFDIDSVAPECQPADGAGGATGEAGATGSAGTAGSAGDGAGGDGVGAGGDGAGGDGAGGVATSAGAGGA